MDNFEKIVSPRKSSYGTNFPHQYELFCLVEKGKEDEVIEKVKKMVGGADQEIKVRREKLEAVSPPKGLEGGSYLSFWFSAAPERIVDFKKDIPKFGKILFRLFSLKQRSKLSLKPIKIRKEQIKNEESQKTQIQESQQ